MAGWGGAENFDQDFDGPHAARVFADAMGLATAALTLERAGNQGDPTLVGEFKAEMARDWGVVADASWTDAELRAALQTARRIPAGGRRENVERCMKELLGDGFIAYRTPLPTEVAIYPADPLTAGNWTQPGAPAKLWKTTGAVSVTGSPITIGVEFVAGSVDALLPGETAVLEAGRHGQCERITIASVTAITTTTANIRTTCTKAHDAGVYLTTAPHPYWFSSQRLETIVITEATLQNAPLMKRLNDLCHKLFRGTSRWLITPTPMAPGVGLLGWIGPFRIGIGRIGITPLDELKVS